MQSIPTVPFDKANHAIYGLLIYLCVLAVALMFHAHPATAAAGGFFVSLSAGWAKELYDRRGHGTHDLYDALATALGGAAGAAATVMPQLIEWLRSLWKLALS
jgi:uncharacterized protein YfiM (DUF2279 family)